MVTVPGTWETHVNQTKQAPFSEGSQREQISEDTGVSAVGTTMREVDVFRSTFHQLRGDKEIFPERRQLSHV